VAAGQAVGYPGPKSLACGHGLNNSNLDHRSLEWQGIISSRAEYNFTSLHSTAMNGHADVCKTLLSAGAGVNVQTDPQGYAPLHSAAFASHIEAIRVLLSHGADRGLLNYRGERGRYGESSGAI